MTWGRWYEIKSYLRSAVWTAPVIALAVQQTTFRIAYVHELDFGPIPGFVYSRGGAIAIADYVITSATAFIVFTFGSMIVAIQVASGQSSPRIIATMLLRDRAIRLSVGVFAYALLLAVAVKARIETIPEFLISVTGVLALISVIVFLFLIDHAAKLLRPVTIVTRIAQDGLAVIDDVYPDPIAADRPGIVRPSASREELARPERTIVHRGKSAVVLAVNLKTLAAEATRADTVIELVPQIGDFVATGDPLFRQHGGRVAIDDRVLQGYVAFGRERTLEQDSTFAFRVIVDIAIKALSAAINDPTTAVIAIDTLQPLLRRVGMRDLRMDSVRDRDGRRRVLFRTPNWNDFVELAFSEIRLLGARDLQVARRLRAMIDSLMLVLPESRLPALRREWQLLDRAVKRSFPFPEDLALARTPDPQGIGGACEHDAQSPRFRREHLSAVDKPGSSS